MNPDPYFSANDFLRSSLEKREEQDAYRRLRKDHQLIDFCSNDYLGFALSSDLRIAIQKELDQLGKVSLGSSGSRLLAGNSDYAEVLESRLAAFHETEASLIYNSGYDANVGLFSALGQTDVTIIYDELIHASVHDGIRLSKASSFAFRHNDLVHLEERLKQATGLVYIAVESIYSMDGDAAPLADLAELAGRFQANLIVDEAHATGITGNRGEGAVQQSGLASHVFARVHTFGKALGCHGAVIVGSSLLRNFLINFSRSFIYTTALPVKSLVAINQAYRMLEQSENEREQLRNNIVLFKKGLVSLLSHRLIASDSPIQCLLVPGNGAVKKIAMYLQDKGMDIRPIMSPTVPKGKERLRICLHAFNTSEEINSLTAEIVGYFSKEKAID